VHVSNYGGVSQQPIEYRYQDRLIAVTKKGHYVPGCDNMREDIVEWQPLAPYGTNEWAWQMRLLDKQVHHPETEKHFAPVRLDIDENETVYRQEFLCDAPLTGWQLYEPAPRFEVGQWVEYANKQCIITKEVEENRYNLTYPDKNIPAIWNSYSQIRAEQLTPIPARDVELDFLNGINGRIVRVENGVENGIAVLDEHNDWKAWIDPDSLAEPMFSVVKNLLARQEKEKS
jgi:hypothetical protein